MSIFNDKALKSVAEAASKIMAQEASHPKTDKEKDLAAMAHPKDKITHKDVLIGRGVLKKEEAGASKEKETKFHSKLDKLVHKTFGKSPAEMKEEKESCEDEAEEVVDKHEKKMHGKKGEVAKHEKEMHKEEVEQLDEYQSKEGVYKHKGTYGTAKGADYGDTDWDKENKDAKKMAKPKASRKLGARQNYVRATRVNESFTQMIASYQEKGLKALAEMSPVEEEVDSETYEKEMKDQKDKFDGKKKGADVAKASVQAVKQEEVENIDEAEKMKGEDPCWKNYEMIGMKNKNGKKVPNCVPKNEEYEVIDANDVNGVTIDNIEERTLTEPEAKKKEEVVMSMKKKLPSFKERYGDRAKEVIYATATKTAKEKA
jgi:hypothetical protein